MIKKLIAPLIITILLFLIVTGYFFLIIAGLNHALSQIPLIIHILVILVFGGIIFGLIYNIIERYKEIKKGEDDDISKY